MQAELLADGPLSPPPEAHAEALQDALCGGAGAGADDAAAAPPPEAALLAMLSPGETHMLTEADITPGGGATALLCPVPGCGRSLRTRPNLQLHLRSHSPERLVGLAVPTSAPKRAGRFFCFVAGCGYAPGGKGTLSCLKTAQNHYFQLHAPKHFACPHPGCGEKQFAKRNQLNRHVKNAHAALQCKCGVSFASKAALVKHLKQFSAAAPGAHAPAEPPAAAVEEEEDAEEEGAGAE
jgi:hypothetical protein